MTLNDPEWPHTAKMEHKSGNISKTRGPKYRGNVTMEGLQELTNALSNEPPVPEDWGFATPTQNWKINAGNECTFLFHVMYCAGYESKHLAMTY